MIVRCGQPGAGEPDRAAAGAPEAASVPLTVQILIDLKSKDPTALTAQEAICHLLGYEDRLLEIRRRHLHELVLATGPEANGTPDGKLAQYLDGTFVFWNPNKQRAWVRSSDPGAKNGAQPWELVAGRRRDSPFGSPGLEDPARDHVLLWARGQGGVPPDLAPALAPWEILAYGRGELYTLHWRPGSALEERERWTASVAVARSRAQGLLVNPHFQDHRVFLGPVPLPLWSSL